LEKILTNDQIKEVKTLNGGGMMIVFRNLAKKSFYVDKIGEVEVV